MGQSLKGIPTAYPIRWQRCTGFCTEGIWPHCVNETRVKSVWHFHSDYWKHGGVLILFHTPVETFSVLASCPHHTQVYFYNQCVALILFRNMSLICHDRLSDDLELSVINAYSALWPVVHQHISELPSPGQRDNRVLISHLISSYHLSRCEITFTRFCLYTHVCFPGLWLSGLSLLLLVRSNRWTLMLSHYNEAADCL